LEKICSKCGLKFTFDKFCKDKQKPDGLTSSCKLCLKLFRNQNHNKDKKREYNKLYNLNNKDSIKNQRREYRKNNKDIISKRNLEYRLLNKDELNSYRREYRKNNIIKERLYQNNYTKIRLKEDSNYKILTNLRNRIYQALKGVKKSSKTQDLLGCSIDFLKLYLEKKFQDGMNWNNYGKWHIDHIKPCASFDLTDIEQQKICFHYTNLQPLWAIDNIKKSNK
jgi:hypothetical protein